ncbi:MAG: hypothetical protein QOJ72_2424 [Nocardioidaceae bacterium]|nr:hypothetical protein [Nocardioidaceae bacterium]
MLALFAITGTVMAVAGEDEATATQQASQVTTAKVVRGKLAAVVSLDGTLTYRAQSDGSPYGVINHATGTYTELPDVGDKIACGGVLYRVDDHPVLLLCGTVPAYRDLQVGDQGKDVRQLNRNLHRLGFDAAGDSDAFTGQTQTALEELQRARGTAVTGRLGPDDAVALPDAVRIGKVTGELGGAARPGAAVARATSGALEVQVDLEASQQGAVKKGDRARITLPGNTSATGRVARLGRVAQIAGKDDDKAGDATISAYLTLDKPAAAHGLDAAPVQVEITTKGVDDALSVPVTAIVGKAGGGFAVEVVRGRGKRGLVAVKLGLFDDTSGRAEVHGELDAGDDVVVPSS